MNTIDELFHRLKKLELQQISIRAAVKQTRKLLVAALDALPYDEYLKTLHWQYVRKAALKRAKYTCQSCSAVNVPLHVHHKSYYRRGHERRTDLIVLCEDCHKRVHNIKNDRRLI